MISHLLSTIPYKDVPHDKVTLPARPSASTGYERPSRELSTYVPNHVAQAARGPREVHLTPRANARCVLADHLRL